VTFGERRPRRQRLRNRDLNQLRVLPLLSCEGGNRQESKRAEQPDADEGSDGKGRTNQTNWEGRGDPSWAATYQDKHRRELGSPRLQKQTNLSCAIGKRLARARTDRPSRNKWGIRRKTQQGGGRKKRKRKRGVCGKRDKRSER